VTDAAGPGIEEYSRWWRDMKLARVGGGTDEVLWELVAAAMKPDHDGYAELIGRGNA
jgi:alkylation response protein AidB-like acyl-CoA dehydrogenase